MNRSTLGTLHRMIVGLAALGALALPSAARALTREIDCAPIAADDFCLPTDNPCIVNDVIVITVPSCTPNFGARTFINNKPIKVPNGGTFTVTAGDIQVNGKIKAKHTKATEGDGADVSLISPGDILITKKVDVSGRLTPGSITIDAGGDISLQQQVIARSKGGKNPAAPGGTITITADGTVTSNKKGKVIVRGKKKYTPAGTASISGDLGVDLQGRVEARGLYGGSVAATSALGNLTIEEEIRVYGEFGTGGTATLSAPAGTLLITGKKGKIRANGGMPGGAGTITLSALIVDAHRNLKARGGHAPGGTINVSGGTVGLKNVDVTGSDGGSINVTSTIGTVIMDGRIDAPGQENAGGSVDVNAATDVTIDGQVGVNGKTSGGEARFTANGDLALGLSDNRKFEAEGTVGGVIEGVATTGDVNAQGDYSAVTGGCIRLAAPLGTVTTGPMSTFNPAFQSLPCP